MAENSDQPTDMVINTENDETQNHDLNDVDQVLYDDYDDDWMNVPDWVHRQLYESGEMIKYLRGREGSLVRELQSMQHILDVKNEELRLLRELREEHYRTVESMQRDIRRTQEADDLNRTELFSTVATERTWHRRRDCNHIANNRVRLMRPCEDCAR